MDSDKFLRWRDLAEKFYGKDFWSQIFDNRQAKEAFINFSDMFGEKPTFPRADVFKKENEIIVILELPGVSKEDIELSFSGDRFTIKGSIRTPDPSYIIMASERISGPFERTLQLPEYIEKEEVSAKYINGLLEVRCPLGHTVTTNTIKIE